MFILSPQKCDNDQNSPGDGNRGERPDQSVNFDKEALSGFIHAEKEKGDEINKGDPSKVIKISRVIKGNETGKIKRTEFYKISRNKRELD